MSFGEISPRESNRLNVGNSNITGTLPVANGGTGLTTLTAHAVLLGEGTSNIAFATVGTSGRLLLDQGSAADPSFAVMSGDATIVNTGVVTIGPNAITTIKINNSAVTYAKIQNTSQAALIGATSATTVGEITLGATLAFSGSALQTTAITGDATASANSFATTVVKVNGISYPAGPAVNTVAVVTGGNAVTYSTVPILAGGTGQTTNTAAFDALAPSSPAQGNILYYNGTHWVMLAPSTSGFFLQTQGAGANPQWAASSGSGTVTQVNTGNGVTGGPITATGTISASITTGALQFFGATLYCAYDPTTYNSCSGV